MEVPRAVKSSSDILNVKTHLPVIRQTIVPERGMKKKDDPERLVILDLREWRDSVDEMKHSTTETQEIVFRDVPHNKALK